MVGLTAGIIQPNGANSQVYFTDNRLQMSLCCFYLYYKFARWVWWHLETHREEHLFLIIVEEEETSAESIRVHISITALAFWMHFMKPETSNLKCSSFQCFDRHCIPDKQRRCSNNPAASKTNQILKAAASVKAFQANQTWCNMETCIWMNLKKPQNSIPDLQWAVSM